MNNQEYRIQELEKKVAELTNILSSISQSSSAFRISFKNDVEFDNVINMKFADGSNIPLGTSVGTKIGTSTSQKLGFYNKTPIVQPSAISAPTSPGGTYSQSEAQSAVSAINSIRSALTNLGLTA